MIKFDGVGQFLNPESGQVESVLMLRGSVTQKALRINIPDEDMQSVVVLFNDEAGIEGTKPPEAPPEEPRGMIRPTDAGSLEPEYAGQVIAQPLGAGSMSFDETRSYDDPERVNRMDAEALEHAAFGEIGEI